MAVTRGERANMTTSQSIFLKTAEEPEDNRINFQDSLKFFQEQLVINGANFPTPSQVFRSGSNSLRKKGHRPYIEQNLDTKGKVSKDNGAVESDIQSIRSCKIDIPTVDTILESVRVLRAIEKSQEERGSSWQLDVIKKSDKDFNDTDEYIQLADVKQNGYCNKEAKSEIQDQTSSTNCFDILTDEDINLNLYSAKKHNDEHEVSSTNLEEKKTVIIINQDVYSTVELDNMRSKEIPSTNSAEKQLVTDIHQNKYSDNKTHKKENSDDTSSTNFENTQIDTDISENGYSNKETTFERTVTFDSKNRHVTKAKQNKYSDNKKHKKESSDETNSTNFENTQTDINENEYSNKETTFERTVEIDSENRQVKNTQVEQQQIVQKENLSNSHNGSELSVPSSNYVNENCSFWPSNTLLNSNQWNHQEKMYDSSSSTEGGNCVLEALNETNLRKHLDTTDSLQLNDKNIDIQLVNKKKLAKEIQRSDACNNYILQDISESQSPEHFQNIPENLTKKDTDIYNTPDSLHAVCTNFLNHLNVKIPNNDEKTEEILLKSETTAEILKVQTSSELDTVKIDRFLLNESISKETCSPNDSICTKIENNDNDSGIRSASSLSPNNPNKVQKGSWSDTCSSHYASAECSPYHSLNSVFESSVELNTAPDERSETENSEVLTQSDWGDTREKPLQDDPISVPQQKDYDEKYQGSHKHLTESPVQVSQYKSHSENAEIFYCNFISNYTIENPRKRIEETEPVYEICDSNENQSKTVNAHDFLIHEQITDTDVNKQTTNKESEKNTEQTFDIEGAESLISFDSLNDSAVEDDSCDINRVQKFTAASCDLISIVESLYTIKDNPAYQVLPTPEEKFEETLFLLSKGAFCEHPEADYLVRIDDSVLHITQNSKVLLSINMKYGEISTETNIIKMDNRMGRCIYAKCDFADLQSLRARIELHCLKHWRTDCLQLVHYPLKCHENVVIIDIGSCSTRAGILMDQPTLPSLFFPTICATDKRTGTCVYGMEALRPEVRQHSYLSFPVRPTNKITKHTIDICLMEGLFKKIFHDLKVDPTQYTVQVCLPRNLSINSQTALVKLLLEVLKAKAVSLTNQALLTLYAHDVSTAVVVDIGDRTDVLPVVDGFIVENGVTRLPHGGQRLIHHMKHGLAEKRISLSNDIDSFVVQYIIENLAYVADDYDNEIQISSQYPEIVTKTVTLEPTSPENLLNRNITLEEARFKIPEGLFNPELWGLDSPGIHHLVQKAILATSVDARKRIAENIYVSGGVTMLPGFVERLNKEVTNLSRTKIVPKVYASNYRYHSSYIGACKFAKMEVFPQVCINLQEYTKNGVSALKKCALYF